MADITFSSYFDNADSSGQIYYYMDPVARDITAYLPDLSVLNPDYSGTWGFCDHVLYDVASDNISIPSAFSFSVGINDIQIGNSVFLFSIPFYLPADLETINCYLGARVNRTGQSTFNFQFGLYSDAVLTTPMATNSIKNISISTTSETNRIMVGAGFFKFPGRTDEHLFPLPSDQYGFAAWTARSQNWTSDDFVLKSTSVTQYDHYYLEPNSGTSSTAWFLDLAELALNHNGLGPYGSMHEDFSPEAGPASEEGGMGIDGDDPSFDNSSDTIGIPDDPLIGVSNVGFVNVYKTGTNSLRNMGLELFPALSYQPPSPITGSDVTAAIVNGVNEFVTFLANIPSFFDQITAATYINYVIDCHVIPVTPSGGTTENIKVGNKTLTVQGTRMSNDYVTFDCGTISLAEYYANFADFLTSAKLYLPFVGFVPARPEWFYRDSLNVTYKFNIVDGSFMAYVRSTGKYVNNNGGSPTIVGQYGGNACVHLPITGVTYASMASGIVGAGAGAVVSAGSGNIAAAATSALSAAAAHGDIAQSNQYASSVSFLGCRRPFLLIERPVSNFSKTYAKEIGIPSNISKKLDSVTGFAMVGDIHLDGITATDQEKNELERLLRNGVIF